MNKSLYSDDIIWYDQSIYNAINALSSKHSNAIPVFGCALSAAKYLQEDNYDFHKFVSFIPTVIQDAKFFKWHGGVINAIHIFCRLCYVDPAIVECYIGMSFDKLIERG